MLKRLGLLLIAVASAALISSCGEEELGGGIGEFTTVSATAVASTSRLESDILTGNSCAGGASTGGNFSTDTVDVSLSSSAMFPNALDLVVNEIIVRYTPANAASPALPDDRTNAPGQRIAPDSSVVIPVTVMSDKYKYDLSTRSTQNLNACSADYFEYYVDILFTVSEPGGNGKSRVVPAKLTVAIADRV